MTIIVCPACEWEPDGNAYWKCTCGHSWNTFDTKGTCPSCETSWKETFCPGCGNSPPHESWYPTQHPKDKSFSEAEIMLRGRKKKVEERLISHGVTNKRIAFLPYLQFEDASFQEAQAVGNRLLVLWCIAYVAGNMEEKDRVESWLKESGLWEHVSPAEKILFKKKQTKRVLNALTWRIDGVIILCWCLNLLEPLPPLNAELSEEALDSLLSKLPLFKDPTNFLKSLSYRNKEEIFLENIVNEMITGYFRDNMLMGREDSSDIDAGISLERHLALNWVRKFGGIDEWDPTDTST